MPPGLVIFDCDGVLVDSEPVSARESLAMARELFLPATIEEASKTALGRSDVDIFAGMAERQGIDLPSGFMESLEARKIEAYGKGVPAMPGAKHAVSRVAAAGLSLCVATSGTPADTRVKLGPVGLLEFFGDSLFTASQVPNGKPATLGPRRSSAWPRCRGCSGSSA